MDNSFAIADNIERNRTLQHGMQAQPQPGEKSAQGNRLQRKASKENRQFKTKD